MGSSKKHKEKDREREHKRKKKHRSRSRSRSRETKYRNDNEDRHDRKRRRERSKDRTKPDRFDEKQLHQVPKPVKIEPHNIDVPTSSNQGGDISLNVEASNKLREKLGLRPLDSGRGGGDADAENGKPVKQEDVHVPAGNLGTLKKSEALREKMLAIKEKRRINKALGKVKTLGASDSEDEGMMAWVTKNRKVSKEKKMAEERAKVLAQMDEEFGVGDLMEEAFAKKKPDYGSRDLRGLKVRHKEDDFDEGQTVILTLEDKNILDDGGDELHNVNMLDKEKLRAHLENKKKKPKYNPYDDANVDEDGILQHKEVLSKYDEEIDGPRQESFQLGAGGRYNAEHEKAMRRLKTDMIDQRETLKLPTPNIASEFYTTQEMETFKKFKKKVRKIRKKPKVVKSDDLIPLDMKNGSSDFGNRTRHDGDTPDNTVGAIPGLDLVEDMEIESQDPLGEAEILGPEEDLSGVVIDDDDAGNELQMVLAKTRRIKQRIKRRDPESVIEKHVRREERRQQQDAMEGITTGEDFEQTNTDEHVIQLNSTSEFCRALGEIPTYGLAGNRPEEEEDELVDFEKELVEQRRKEAEEEEAAIGPGGWQAVEIDTAPVNIREEDHTALEEETIVDVGLASALLLAQKKGYLVQEPTKRTSSNHPDLDNANYSIDDKHYEDPDDKYTRRDRFGGGMTQDFKELETYKPKVKLKYVDETGRSLNRKEAFRQLSHRFHGKGSGKKKIEKRMRKIEQDTLLMKASSSDTPLGTVELLRQKQKSDQSPFVVLSGNKSASASIAKN